ncbi:MAG TPA: aldehyde dehydrogenase family protein [Patescibacteria group bacterium]|nr:aldehyde dehydrogenase family protein [Patescibacteria group bacterium]
MDYLNYIDGQFISGKSGLTFNDLNPSNKEEVIGTFPRSNQEDVNEAVKAAKKAFAGWSATPAPKRGEIIYRAGQLLLERKEEISRAIVREMGKVKAAADGDVQSAADMAFYAAGEGRRLYGQTAHSALANRMAFARRVPVGVCALITPWNAPAAAIAWKLFPALICGNAAVVKPAEDTPLAAQLIFEILEKAGLPAGVANLVQGYGQEAGEALANHSDVNLISFTGSTEVGRHLSEIGSKKLIKVSLEMGGKNGVLVMEDADLDLAAEAVVSGAFTIAGQRCAATSRVVVHSSVYDQFLEKLVNRTKTLKVGPADDESSYITPIINQKQLAQIAKYVEEAKTAGAEVLTGGEILTKGEYSNGFYFAPTILINVKPKDKIFQEEVFGPVAVVVKYGGLEEGLELMNATNYGLTASVFTKDSAKGLRMIDGIRAGVVYLNAPTFGSEVHLPFGGFGLSGNGHREAGLGGLDVFSDWQTVYLDYSGGIQNSQTKK